MAFCYSARNVRAAPAAVAGLGDGPRAGPPGALHLELAALHRSATPPAGPAVDAVVREGLSPGRGRLRGGRSRPGVVRGGRRRGGDHPGDAAGLVRAEHPRTRRCLRRARPHRRLPALGHRASRHAGAAAHPLQERLRRPHGRPRPDRGRDDAQPLPEACHLRAAPAGGHGRAGPRLGDRRSAVKAGRLLAWGGVIALAWLARGLALPVFLAAALAYLLSPAVAWADALAIRRSAAGGALFAVTISPLGVAGFLLGAGVGAETAALG